MCAHLQQLSKQPHIQGAASDEAGKHLQARSALHVWQRLVTSLQENPDTAHPMGMLWPMQRRARLPVLSRQPHMLTQSTKHGPPSMLGKC